MRSAHAHVSRESRVKFTCDFGDVDDAVWHRHMADVSQDVVDVDDAGEP